MFPILRLSNEPAAVFFFRSSWKNGRVRYRCDGQIGARQIGLPKRGSIARSDRRTHPTEAVVDAELHNRHRLPDVDAGHRYRTCRNCGWTTAGETSGQAYGARAEVVEV